MYRHEGLQSGMAEIVGIALTNHQVAISNNVTHSTVLSAANSEYGMTIAGAWWSR
jgi:hypothetical protein